MSDGALFHVRAGIEGDVPFIFNSWLKSYRDSPAVRAIPNTAYYEGHHALIERILPRAMVRVACDPQAQGDIFGYVVGEGATIHWIYVKHPFRGYGVARALLATLGGPTHYTHRVKNMDRLLKDRPLVFNPYLLYK